MFVFKLEAALKLKETIEDKKKRALGEVMQHKDYLSNQKSALLKKKNDTKYAFNYNQAINSTELLNLNRYHAVLDEKIQDTNSAIISAESQILEKQKELATAMQERKILDNLKDKQHTFYKTDCAIREQKVLDEVISYQYAKRTRGAL